MPGLKSLIIPLLILLLIIIIPNNYTFNRGRKEIVKINNVELQLIDGETKKPIPNISIQYFLLADRPKHGFIYATESEHIIISEGSTFSDNNGVIIIKENSYSIRTIDTLTLQININIKIDHNRIVSELKEKYSNEIFINELYHDYVRAYFYEGIYRNYTTFINKKYYPAYVLFWYSDGKNSYIINQINNNGDKTDFQTKDKINNIIFGSNSDIIQIELVQFK